MTGQWVAAAWGRIVAVHTMITAEQAELAQSRVAGALQHLRRGDRVALVVPPGTDLVTAVAGALRVGVVPVVLDPGTPAAELADLLADADAALVVDSAEKLDELHAGDPAPLAEVPLGRPMHYTSGTTGRRKGVWSGVLAVETARRLWGEERELWGFGPDDLHVVVSPLYHSAPLRFAIGTLLAGGSVLAPGRFDPERFLALAVEHRPTTLFTAPAQLQRLRELDDPRTAEVLGRLRLLAHAGAPCPDVVKRWVLDHADHKAVWEFYGSTEGQFTACSAADWERHPNTVGKARPGRTLSTDPDGTIWCTVPEHGYFEYWRAPDKTAQTWRDTPHGRAFSVGDLGRLDEEGYLYLDGRRDDLVITGGVNVYPLEVERVLEQCPAVHEIAVYGVDDERWGQRVEAAVVLRPGVDTSEPIATFARERLTPAQRPKALHVRDALPRTSTGKVLRGELRASRPESS
ncbi:class I adenylate-forming enzyme family protein [Rhodococcus sp. X156]|uniref:class I adenylate-forming enzyme family protein n=1 Tax=Rhodococcus sp. X156 TaxID=2499145 RepID=UPI0019CFA57E|nr:class I adenylate-forming enzyme family protein [Rhodococcus sp. X156]